MNTNPSLRSRPRLRIPQTLSANEANAMLLLTQNKKHKAMLALLYGCGLRISEVINMRCSDVSHDSRTITILGKGNKYRLGYLHPGTYDIICEYLNEYLPTAYLFPGQASEQYSVNSLQKVVSAAAIRANISKRVHAHMLRHSFATHSLEKGANLFDLKNALGHVFLSSTEIYLHCSTAHLRRMPDLLY